MEELNVEEIKKKIEELTSLKNELKNEEQAIKLTMNSIYGAIGNAYFVCFNPEVAESVTLQGQDLIKFSEKVVFKYFNEYWQNDKELHEKLGITYARKVTSPMTVYGDTDSLFSTCTIISKFDGNVERIRFDDLFRLHSKFNDIITDERGNEIIEPEGLETLNSVGNEKDSTDIRFSGVRKIIRHKVRKPKWRIVTESGEEVIVTNDHSVMVFRDGKKLAVKPSEINTETDEILSVSVDI